MSDKVYVGSVGVKIIVETGMDLSSASKVSLLVKKPDGRSEEWVGEAVDTRIEYVTKEGDLDIPGFYRVQAFVDYGTSRYYGETKGFYVYNLYE